MLHPAMSQMNNSPSYHMPRLCFWDIISKQALEVEKKMHWERKHFSENLTLFWCPGCETEFPDLHVCIIRYLYAFLVRIALSNGSGQQKKIALRTNVNLQKLLPQD